MAVNVLIAKASLKILEFAEFAHLKSFANFELVVCLFSGLGKLN